MSAVHPQTLDDSARVYGVFFLKKEYFLRLFMAYNMHCSLYSEKSPRLKILVEFLRLSLSIHILIGLTRSGQGTTVNINDVSFTSILRAVINFNKPLRSLIESSFRKVLFFIGLFASLLCLIGRLRCGTHSIAECRAALPCTTHCNLNHYGF